MRIADIPPNRLPTYQRAMSGKCPADGIKAHCQMCMGYEELPRSVKECTAPDCPLYPYRLTGRRPPTEAEREAGRRKTGNLRATPSAKSPEICAIEDGSGSEAGSETDRAS